MYLKMFKKPHTTKPSNQLSNSACKKLVSQVSTGLEQERLKGEKRISVARAYTHTGQEQQLTIYYDSDGEPIYFQMTTPYYLVPSIYTLIRFPTLLPTIITNHHVLDKLLHGADLMLPGLHKPDLLPLVHLVQNELVSIRGHLPDDPIWAVGYLAQDVSLLLKAESGKAVITVELHLDLLTSVVTLLTEHSLSFSHSFTLRTTSYGTPDPNASRPP
jgi:translation initiation factor 2D